MTKPHEIIGWAYDGEFHCCRCARKRFRSRLADVDDLPIDTNGNEVRPIFLEDVESDEYLICYDCLELVEL